MKIETNLAAKNAEIKETRAEKTIRLLMSLDGDPRHQKLKEFEKFYPAVLHAMSRKVPRKTILKHLSEGGLKLYPGIFEEFMILMDRGDVVFCNHCGQPINASPQHEATGCDSQEGKLPAWAAEAQATGVQA